MPRDSHYLSVVLFAVLFSSYLRVLECSMSFIFGDYSPSEMGGSQYIEEKYDSSGSSTILEASGPFKFGDFMTTGIANQRLLFSESRSLKPLLKKKRTSFSRGDSFSNDSKKEANTCSDIEDVEVECLKRKRSPKAEEDNSVPLINSENENLFEKISACEESPSIRFDLPPSQFFSFKGFLLEPIDAKLSPQDTVSSPATTESSGIKLVTPLKDAPLSFPRRKNQGNTNLAGLSPNSITFTPIIEATTSLSTLYKLEKGEEDSEEVIAARDSDNEDFDRELAGIFEDFGFYEIDEDGKIKGGRPLNDA